MGILTDSIQSIGPHVPETMEKHVQIRTTIELQERECHLFSVALSAVDAEFRKDFPDREPPNIVISFLEKSHIQYDMGDSCYGSHIDFVFYNVTKIREDNFPDEKLLVIYLEELCHALWQISDEIIVKMKVTSVYNSYYKTSYPIEAFYSKPWLMQNGYTPEDDHIKEE